MSSTLTTPPPSDSSAPGGRSSEKGAASQPWRKTKSSSGKIGWILVAVIVAGAGTGIWWMVGVARAANLDVKADRYTVVRRSFTISLKEKGELKAAKSTQLKCEVEGRSTIIRLIAEGAAVKEGDLLVELASDQIDDRIRQQELQLAKADLAYDSAKTELEIQRDRNESDIRKGNLDIELLTLALEKYEEGDWPQKKKDAEIEIERAEITLTRRGEDYEAAKTLREKEYITKAEHDEDRFNLKKATWDLEKANRSLVILKEYTDKTDRRRMRSDVEEAKKELLRVTKNAQAEERKKIGSVEAKRKELELIRDELAKLEAQKQRCSIYAPAQGFVVYGTGGGGGGRHFREEDQIREGATVRERQVLVTLPDTSTMIVVTRIHESKTDRIELGQTVRVYVEGLPDKHFSGTITKIASVADSSNRWLNPDLKEYETEITLEGSDPQLKPGATAHAEIFVGQVNDALAIPVQAVFARGRQHFVFQDVGDAIKAVQITLGATSTEWAQVVDGSIAEQDQILLAFGESEKRLLPDAPEGEGRAMPTMNAPPSTEASGQKSRKGYGSGGGRAKGAQRRGSSKAASDRSGTP